MTLIWDVAGRRLLLMSKNVDEGINTQDIADETACIIPLVCTSLSSILHHIIHEQLFKFQTMFYLQSSKLIHANCANFLHRQELFRGPSICNISVTTFVLLHFIQQYLQTEFQFAEHHVPKAVDAATGLQRRNVHGCHPADQDMYQDM